VIVEKLEKRAGDDVKNCEDSQRNFHQEKDCDHNNEHDGRGVGFPHLPTFTAFFVVLEQLESLLLSLSHGPEEQEVEDNERDAWYNVDENHPEPEIIIVVDIQSDNFLDPVSILICTDWPLLTFPMNPSCNIDPVKESG
jgi:hypothetical protein